MSGLTKVHPGDPLVIPTATYSTFVAAARDCLAHQQDQARSAQPGKRHGGIVPVRNGLGSDPLRARSEHPIAVDARACPP